MPSSQHHQGVAFEQRGVGHDNLQVLRYQAPEFTLRTFVVVVVRVPRRVQRPGVCEDDAPQSPAR